jgi:hypothetical protein
MKKFKLSMMAIVLTIASIGQVSAQNVLDQIKNIANAAGVNSSTVTDAISNVIGSSTAITAKDLIGTWKYNGSRCAFQSANLLAQAGGEVAANKIESNLNSYYSKMGIRSTNTQFTFNEDKTFAAKVYGRNITGTYTFDAKQKKITCQGLLLSFPCYVTKTGSNINLLFESSKLLTLLQTVAKLSGNSTLSTIGTLSKNYKGAKIGFRMKK